MKHSLTSVSETAEAVTAAWSLQGDAKLYKSLVTGLVVVALVLLSSCATSLDYS